MQKTRGGGPLEAAVAIPVNPASIRYDPTAGCLKCRLVRTLWQSAGGVPNEPKRLARCRRHSRRGRNVRVYNKRGSEASRKGSRIATHTHTHIHV